MNEKKKLIMQIIIFVLLLLIITGIYHIITKESPIEEEIVKEESQMEVLKFSSDNFEKEVLQSDIPVLVDFYADWCGPCKMMSPVISEIAGELGEKAKVGKINVDDNQDLAVKYNVMSIPTIIIFKKGMPVKTFVGVQNKEDILKELN